MGTIAILTFDVWADTNTDDVYEIPEDYQSRNYVVQTRSSYKQYLPFPKSDGTDTESDLCDVINDEIYDFTVYYPKDLYSSLVIVSGSYEKNFFSIWFFPQNDNSRKIIFSGSIGTSLKFDMNNIAKSDLTCKVDNEEYNIIVYIKKNNASQHLTIKPSKHDGYGTDNILSLSSISDSHRMQDLTLFTVNNPFIFRPYSGYDKLIYSGVYGTKYMVQKIPCSKIDNYLDTNISAVRAVEKIISANGSSVFPEPVLKSCKKVSDSVLHCFYEFPSQNRVPSFKYVYPKIYVKLDGKDWQEFQEYDSDADALSQHVFNLNIDESNKSIWGALSLTAVYRRLGYTNSEIFSDDFVPPKIQGIIWGVQYGYALTQNILDESSIRKSKIVFSRYVFEDNLVDTPDVSIGDLGDLPNISGANSSIGVDIPNSGSSSSDRDNGGHHVGDSSSGSDNPTSIVDWFKNFKFDFSSITNAITGTFSLAASFASLIGSVFQNFFGESVAILAMLAIGICVVLRLVGR